MSGGAGQPGKGPGDGGGPGRDRGGGWDAPPPPPPGWWPPSRRWLAALRRALLGDAFVLGLCLVIGALLAATTPGFATVANLGQVLSNMLPLLALALGQMVVLIARGIDLSVTGVVALASVCGALLATGDGGPLAGSPLAPAAAVAAMLGVGLVVGLFNGASVALLGMPPFIVTLTTTMFFGGLAVWVTGSANIYNLPAGLVAIGGSTAASAAIVAAAALALHLGLTRTLYGRWLYAAGRNPSTARVSGVPVGAVTVGAYAVCGLCAGLAAVLYTGRLETGSPTMGKEVLLDVIGAVVIGGTSLFGGDGKVPWTVFGVLFLTLVDNGLLLRNVSPFAAMSVKGGIILLAALVDRLRFRAAQPAAA